MNETVFTHEGRMNDPHSCAYVKGICGDEMEFYLIFDNSIISDIKFYSTGCVHTKICGQKAAEFVIGKTIDDALSISPANIKKQITDLPEDHLHCTILATITILKAIADYLYKRLNA